MRDTLKIGLGIVLGLALGAGLYYSGILPFGAALPPPEEEMEQATEEIDYPTPEPVPEEKIFPLGTPCIVDSTKVIVTEYHERHFLPAEKITYISKFVLIHVVVENVGEPPYKTVLGDEFALIYKGEAVRPGGIIELIAAGYPTPLPAWEIRRGMDYDFWLPFSVPKAADPGEMVIVFWWPGVRYYWGLGER